MKPKSLVQFRHRLRAAQSCPVPVQIWSMSPKSAGIGRHVVDPGPIWAKFGPPICQIRSRISRCWPKLVGIGPNSVEGGPNLAVVFLRSGESCVGGNPAKPDTNERRRPPETTTKYPGHHMATTTQPQLRGHSRCYSWDYGNAHLASSEVATPKQGPLWLRAPRDACWHHAASSRRHALYPGPGPIRDASTTSNREPWRPISMRSRRITQHPVHERAAVQDEGQGEEAASTPLSAPFHSTAERTSWGGAVPTHPRGGCVAAPSAGGHPTGSTSAPPVFVKDHATKPRREAPNGRARKTRAKGRAPRREQTPAADRSRNGNTPGRAPHTTSAAASASGVSKPFAPKSTDVWPQFVLGRVRPELARVGRESRHLRGDKLHNQRLGTVLDRRSV